MRRYIWPITTGLVLGVLNSVLQAVLGRSVGSPALLFGAIGIAIGLLLTANLLQKQTHGLENLNRAGGLILTLLKTILFSFVGMVFGALLEFFDPSLAHHIQIGVTGAIFVGFDLTLCWKLWQRLKYRY